MAVVEGYRTNAALEKACYGKFKSFFKSLNDGDIDSIAIMTSDRPNYCLGIQPVNNPHLPLGSCDRAHILPWTTDRMLSISIQKNIYL